VGVVGVGLRGLLGRAKRGSVEGREEGGGTIERREEVRSSGRVLRGDAKPRPPPALYHALRPLPAALALRSSRGPAR